jgi:hypothetical protein
MIGYPVSGHPLDGTHEFIRSKSKNIGKIYEWLEKRKEIVPVEMTESGMGDGSDDSSVSVSSDNAIIQTPGNNDTLNRDPDSPPPIDDMSDLPSQAEILQHMEVEKEDETVNATVIGLVTSIRKIQTKTGGMMLMATMESAGFDLRLVIFSRDYDAYVSKVEEDRILIIE